MVATGVRGSHEPEKFPLSHRDIENGLEGVAVFVEEFEHAACDVDAFAMPLNLGKVGGNDQSTVLAENQNHRDALGYRPSSRFFQPSTRRPRALLQSRVKSTPLRSSSS